MCAHQSGQPSPLRKLTLLATSRALIKGRDGELCAVRLLIDPGSELSFISEDLVQRARLKRSAASVPLLGIGGTYAGRTRGVVSIELSSIHNPSSKCHIEAYVLSRLTAKIPPCDLPSRPWSHTKELQLADPDYASSGPIHIIIGSDYYGSVILPGLIQGEPSSPVAQQTILGWILSGTISTNNHLRNTQAHHCSLDRDLQELISRFWTQEDIPSSANPKLTKDEEECERLFQSTHARDATGRYIVRLPLKSEVTLLGDSKSTALHCLNRLNKRFSTNPEFMQLYRDFVQEYQRLGHMVAVDTLDKPATSTYYLPHHGVLRENNLTTKLRVVFNASRS